MPGFFRIFGLAPYSFPCQAHGAKPQTFYFKVVTDFERFAHSDHGCTCDDRDGAPDATKDHLLNTSNVEVADAYNLPSASVSLASANATLWPNESKLPSARRRPVSLVIRL